MDKVEITDHCWLWKASVHKGYGQFYFNGTMVAAHKASYILHGGTIFPGHELDHKCRKPLCVRPDHLRQTTHKQNLENRHGAQCNSTTGIRGVYLTRGRKWRAIVKHHGKQIYVGTFSDTEAAHVAVREKRLELFTHSDQDQEG